MAGMKTTESKYDDGKKDLILVRHLKKIHKRNC